MINAQWLIDNIEIPTIIVSTPIVFYIMHRLNKPKKFSNDLTKYVIKQKKYADSLSTKKNGSKTLF